uniref:Helicase ATP-binding domain-containing protein n=1 Tax=viral metagenome TaxID=1070528 RepID=A0A6C0KSI1_9ZZZZ
MAKVGQLYIREHEAYDIYGACKLGITQNISNRETTYITGEIRRGEFSHVFEIPLEKLLRAELWLRYDFKNFNVYIDGGTEFYKKSIIPLIIAQLKKRNIEARQLSLEEIDNIKRKEYINQRKKRLANLIAKQLKETIINPYTRRTDQTDIINLSLSHFQEHNKGLLVLICGIGKTLISLWISQDLAAHTILIGVPNILLLIQWEKVIAQLFPGCPCLIVKSSVSIEDISLFLNKNKEKCIVITTYASSHKVCSASLSANFRFDMKILDEAHHLTSQYIIKEEHKTYVKILEIDCVKQLSLTATLKILENKDCSCDDDLLISNSNEAYFGKIITKRPLLWAIQNNIVCDYIIQTLYTNEDQLNTLALLITNQGNNTSNDDENDKRLLLSAYAGLKSIADGHSHHLLIYVNNKEHALKVNSYIEKLLSESYFSVDNLYCSNYDSSMNKETQKNILASFEKAHYGIITCVYCLGEGWDFPLLDGVVFAENMTSNIRIVQSALRASRKNAKQPDKLTKIILPIINNNNWLDNSNNSDWKKVREVIYQMGLEDETISYKIKVVRVDIVDPHKPRPKPIPKPPIISDLEKQLEHELRLKTVKRCALGTSYEKAKKIIAEHNIKTKEDYYALTLRLNKLPDDPETAYKGVFTNWIDYLSIERVYYDLKTCKSKVNEYLDLYPEIRFTYFKNLDLAIVCSELCAKDSLFPPYGFWVDYYNLRDLRELIEIKYKKKSPSIIL